MPALSAVAARGTRLRRAPARAARVVESRHARALITAAGARRNTGTGVALTFDDGPMPGCTDRLLDVLLELQVSATFFCVGRNAERSPALVRRMAADGHAIGSHSLTHPHPRDLSPQQLRHEYSAGRRAVEHALGAEVRLFRPPHGHLSLMTARVVRPYRPWLWSADPEDWRPGAERSHVEGVAGQAADGDVVLLHDWVEQPVARAALDRSATIEALPAVVAAVRARGLSFVRLGP